MLPTRISRAGLFLSFVVLAAGENLPAQQGNQGDDRPPAQSSRPANVRLPKTRLDLFGDPLPDGAVARLGTARFRRGGLVLSVSFSPDGKQLASASYDDTVRLWDAATGKEIRRLDGHKGRVFSVSFSPDGKQLASASDDKTVRLWDAATGKEIRRLDGHKGWVISVSFSPDGKQLASASDDKTVRLWDVAEGKEIRRLNGHQRPVASVSFSPDGKMLASGSGDKTVCLWDAATGKEICRLQGHKVWVNSVSFSPDGKLLASGSVDTTGLVWDVRRFGRVKQPANLADKDLQAFWSALAGADAPQAYAAIADLADAPHQAVPFLQNQLRPPPAPDPKRLARLIADLDSDQFAARQKAEKELEEIGELAEPALRQVWASKPPLEVRRRVEQLLEKLESLTPERLQQSRAIQALEWMGAPEAKELLAKLAQGPKELRLTREAQASLKRLAKLVGTP